MTQTQKGERPGHCSSTAKKGGNSIQNYININSSTSTAEDESIMT